MNFDAKNWHRFEFSRQIRPKIILYRRESCHFWRENWNRNYLFGAKIEIYAFQFSRQNKDMKNGQFPISLILNMRHAFRIFGDWNSIIPKLANCQYIISQHNPFSSLRQFNWLLTLGIHGATQGHGKIEDMSTILLFFSFPRRPRTVGWYGIFWYMTNVN